MNWDSCQYLYGWLELMVHHTPSKARVRSVPYFIHLCRSILGVLCCQYGCAPLAWLLVQCGSSLTHAPILDCQDCQYLYGWVESMLHHTSFKGRVRSVPLFFHPCRSILGILCVQYGCDHPVWLFVQWYIHLTQGPIDELPGVSTPVGMDGAHGKSHTV